MENNRILEKLEAIISPILENLGYQLVDCELITNTGRMILRVYIDKDGGITIGDCSSVSRSIGDVIEIEDILKKAYSLEVSSPGLDRPLRKPEDFKRFSGSTVKLKTARPVNGRSNYKGLLEGMDGNDIVIRVDGVECRVPITELSKARVEPDEASFKSKTIN